MATPELISKLNDILSWEWTGVSQYSQYSFVLSGNWREVYSERFREGAKESFGHAQRIGDKIAAYGGVPTVERTPIKQTSDLIEMLNHSLAFEQGAVDLYSEALALADGVDRALVVLLEDVLLEEQDGVDELTMIIRDHAGEGVEQEDVAKVG